MKTPISLEFYPPKTQAQIEQFDRTASRLMRYAPEFTSCTFGAGGSTLTHTPSTVRRLREKHGMNAAPHLSCMGGNKVEFDALLDEYLEMGVDSIVALRGDLPSGMGHPGEFNYAVELIRYIHESKPGRFRVYAAAYPEKHPQARNVLEDTDRFIEKVEAGVDAAITQYFYNADAYIEFVNQLRKRHVDVPVIAGIMPIADFTKISQFSAQCGTEIPRWITQRMEAYGENVQSQRQFGAEVVAKLCERLTENGAPGFHFYTLNLAKPTERVLDLIA